MALCPRCNQQLARATTPVGIVHLCRTCGGRAIGMSVLRKLVSAEAVKQLWLQARHAEAAIGLPCPFCQRPMSQTPFPAGSRVVALDVCAACQFVWLDREELQQLPPPAPAIDPTKQLPEKAREAIARAKLKTLERRQEIVDDAPQYPEEGWKWIPALIGLPVELDAEVVSCRPWLTWSLAGAMVIVYLLTIGNLDNVIKALGLVPAQFTRLGGLTFLTSFFIHAGFFHLLGNVYFLLVFGDNVEEILCIKRYALLIVAAALAGDVLHILCDPLSMIPCVGASGGISGIIGYYALRFPHVRLGIMYRLGLWIGWLRLRAWQAAGLWLLLQCVLALEQLAGIGNVAAMAHLGGFAVGVLAFLWWRTCNSARAGQS